MPGYHVLCTRLSRTIHRACWQSEHHGLIVVLVAWVMKVDHIRRRCDTAATFCDRVSGSSLDIIDGLLVFHCVNTICEELQCAILVAGSAPSLTPQ